jgi:hypothetical protein
MSGEEAAWYAQKEQELRCEMEARRQRAQTLPAPSRTARTTTL